MFGGSGRRSGSARKGTDGKEQEKRTRGEEGGEGLAAIQPSWVRRLRRSEGVKESRHSSKRKKIKSRMTLWEVGRHCSGPRDVPTLFPVATTEPSVYIT